MIKSIDLAGALLSVLSIVVAGCGGDDGGGSNLADPLVMSQGGHSVAYLDANGGIYTHLIPTQIEAYRGQPVSGYSFAVETGTALPFPGLFIDPLTGLVHGDLPGDAVSGPDQYPFSATASDGVETVTAQWTITIFDCNSETVGDPDPSNCYFDETLDAGGGSSHTIDYSAQAQAGHPFGFSMPIWGGQPPYQGWGLNSGSLPPGLTLDQSRGVIYGTPLSSAAGMTYTFTVTVSDQVSTFPSPDDSPSSFTMTVL